MELAPEQQPKKIALKLLNFSTGKCNLQNIFVFCFVLVLFWFGLLWFVFFWPNHSAAQKFKLHLPHWHSHSLQLAHSSQKSFKAQFMKMSTIVLQMSQQVLGVSFPLSKQKQSAALLSQCGTTSSWTDLPGKAFPNVPGMQTDSCLHTPLVDTLVKCLAQPQQRTSQRNLVSWSQRFTSKCFHRVHAILDERFDWWYDGEDQVFPTLQRTWT